MNHPLSHLTQDKLSDGNYFFFIVFVVVVEVIWLSQVSLNKFMFIASFRLEFSDLKHFKCITHNLVYYFPLFRVSWKRKKNSWFVSQEGPHERGVFDRDPWRTSDFLNHREWFWQVPFVEYAAAIPLFTLTLPHFFAGRILTPRPGAHFPNFPCS